MSDSGYVAVARAVAGRFEQPVRPVDEQVPLE